ncbi:hypothetical protein CC80DRAFT_493292 [Byssothecium circinans]|uniref:Uncharacterized protein n=1 Tax=Byssothecium circinans TaxID=147558 RepID=A0A6A5TUI1_9PLEO|nr:hypothetical protein CC80DRAFT_493292 [Byssothecium circinans]
MDSTKARSASVSSSIAGQGTRKNSLFPSVSDHGMPKSRSPQLPDGNLLPNRFSGVGLPTSPRPSEPPMSPPLSARSFGTFIDSEPSTPAYSPRTGSSWEGSTLVLLSPVPSSPETPAEPTWEMMVPIQKPPKKRSNRFSRKPTLVRHCTIDDKEVGVNTSLTSHPVKHIRSHSEKGIHTTTEEPDEEKAEKPKKKEDDEEEQTHNAPLDRLALKMRSLLRRRSDPDKKAEKKWKGYDELQRMETSHWTEL